MSRKRQYIDSTSENIADIYGIPKDFWFDPQTGLIATNGLNEITSFHNQVAGQPDALVAKGGGIWTDNAWTTHDGFTMNDDTCYSLAKTERNNWSATDSFWMAFKFVQTPLLVDLQHLYYDADLAAGSNGGQDIYITAANVFEWQIRDSDNFIKKIRIAGFLTDAVTKTIILQYDGSSYNQAITGLSVYEPPGATVVENVAADIFTGEINSLSLGKFFFGKSDLSQNTAGTFDIFMGGKGILTASQRTIIFNAYNGFQRK